MSNHAWAPWVWGTTKTALYKSTYLYLLPIHPVHMSHLYSMHTHHTCTVYTYLTRTACTRLPYIACIHVTPVRSARHTCTACTCWHLHILHHVTPGQPAHVTPAHSAPMSHLDSLHVTPACSAPMSHLDSQCHTSINMYYSATLTEECNYMYFDCYGTQPP